MYGRLLEERAPADRNLTNDLANSFEGFVKNNDLGGKIIFDFGAGKAELEELLLKYPQNQPALIIFFELAENVAEIPEKMRQTAERDLIKFNTSDYIEQHAGLLLLNPTEYLYEKHKNVGDFRYYDIHKMLAHASSKGLPGEFLILGNPPYFLWNRILSLTNLPTYSGLLAITGAGRILNHLGGEVVAVYPATSFSPPAKSASVLIAHQPNNIRFNLDDYKVNELKINASNQTTKKEILTTDEINTLVSQGKETNKMFNYHAEIPTGVSQWFLPLNYIFPFPIIFQNRRENSREAIFYTDDFYSDLCSDPWQDASDTLDIAISCCNSDRKYDLKSSSKYIQDFFFLVEMLCLALQDNSVRKHISNELKKDDCSPELLEQLQKKSLVFKEKKKDFMRKLLIENMDWKRSVTTFNKNLERSLEIMDDSHHKGLDTTLRKPCEIERSQEEKCTSSYYKNLGFFAIKPQLPKNKIPKKREVDDENDKKKENKFGSRMIFK